MAELLAFHTYHTRHSFLSPSTMLSRPTSHRRSISSENRSLSPDRTLTKARSVSDLFGITTDRPGSGNRSSSVGNFADGDGGFSTLQDPRLVNNSSDSSEASSPDTHHPALSNEVAALSVKLVQAINNQTILDDNLVAARQELEQARSKISVLEQENLRYRRDIDTEVLIKKSDVEYDMLRLKAALADEKAQRALIEKEKKGIEQELETLTAALFEEANKMVAAAKVEREAVEKKNEQLRAQIKDTESLLASQQDQLAELKSVLQGVTCNSKDELEVRTTASTAPSSPTASRQPSAVVNSIEPPMCPQDPPPPVEELAPGPSTSFPHLIRTVSRTDLQAFEDFRELFTLSTTAASKPASRATSGSYAGLNVMSLASFGSSAFGSAASSPAKSQTHSPHGSLSSPQPMGSSIPLKETRFYKRALVEDIEPTLRLDAAPGISWLTRRSVMSGICDGTLVVEPMPPASKKYEFPCSLCGERRSGTANERTHRFRTSDSETAQRYPLCVLCVEKARSSCEFTGYLRLILDGHLRLSDVGDEKYAWEETIRLRERMFWSRIGGGIVPIFTPPASYVSPPDSVDPLPETADDDREISPRDVTGKGREETMPATENSDRRDDRSETNDDSDRESIYQDSFISMAPESPTHSEAATVQDGKAETQTSSPAQADPAEPVVEPVTDTPSHREDDHDRPVPDAQR